MGRFFQRGPGAAGLLAALLVAAPAFASGTLSWDTEKDKVSADLKSEDLLGVLEKIAGTTRWHIYVEPDALHSVSAKFKNLPPGEALHMLLGDVNFAMIPETNANPKLYVFRTSRHNATQLVMPKLMPEKTGGKAKVIPNELIVRLKPGAKIDDIARLLGAKVIGRIDGLNSYRLQFDNQTAADTARQQLANNSDVTSVDNNWSIDRPPSGGEVLPGTVPPPQLQLNPPPDKGGVIVGIVDTSVQDLGKSLDSFLLKRISVAGDAPSDPNSPEHGTSMVDTMFTSLQAATKGATTVRGISADVYGPNPTTTSFDVANGIVQVVNGGATIVNLSLGSDADSPFLHSVIQDAASKNITFIGAAGNTPVTSPFYPAAYPEVNAVTAVDQGQLAPYANRGSFVTLGAPGTSVINFDNLSWSVTGTSASAAFTSGIAAAYLEAHPNATPANIQRFLRSTFGVNLSPTP